MQLYVFHLYMTDMQQQSLQHDRSTGVGAPNIAYDYIFQFLCYVLWHCDNNRICSDISLIHKTILGYCSKGMSHFALLVQFEMLAMKKFIGRERNEENFTL